MARALLKRLLFLDDLGVLGKKVKATILVNFNTKMTLSI